MHNPRHPHQPHPHQQPSPPPSHPRSEGQRFNSPAITEEDQQLLMELLNNPQEAQEIFCLLQNSPPELATIGYLVLRVLEKVQGSQATQ